MTNTELVAFLRHFADTRDWATWSAIADRYTECGDELGAEIALRIQRERYWPNTLYPNGMLERECYRWSWIGDFVGGTYYTPYEHRDYILPDDAISAVYDVRPGGISRRYPCATVIDAYRRLIDGFRDGMTR